MRAFASPLNWVYDSYLENLENKECFSGRSKEYHCHGIVLHSRSFQTCYINVSQGWQSCILGSRRKLELWLLIPGGWGMGHKSSATSGNFRGEGPSRCPSWRPGRVLFISARPQKLERIYKWRLPHYFPSPPSLYAECDGRQNWS